MTLPFPGLQTLVPLEPGLRPCTLTLSWGAFPCYSLPIRILPSLQIQLVRLCLTRNPYTIERALAFCGVCVVEESEHTSSELRPELTEYEFRLRTSREQVTLLVPISPCWSGGVQREEMRQTR